MIFPQHTTLPFSTAETDQLQYDTPHGGFLQANPQQMSFAGPGMDMPMPDIDMLNFSLADLDALCSAPNGSNGMLLRHQWLLPLTDATNSQW